MQSGGDDPGKKRGKVVVSCSGAKPDGTIDALGCQEVGDCEKTGKKAAGNKDGGCMFKCLNKSTKTETLK